MKSYISGYLCWHSASLQLRSHSYGYAPSVVPRIVPAQVARNIRFHMASYLRECLFQGRVVDNQS
ncbi:hypothetical protein, partial [Endozoicomonas acroporae]|uniref:hypothetical protein n=1 Tax=Endozoicomonas acroporae TaxID=1701104 RepID=UPI0019D5A045